MNFNVYDEVSQIQTLINSNTTGTVEQKETEIRKISSLAFLYLQPYHS